MNEFDVMYYRRPGENSWRVWFDLKASSAISDGEKYDLVKTYEDMGYEVVVQTVELPK